MTPENREYILTLLDSGLSQDEICRKVCVGCDCLPCTAIEEYATWVYIGEYTQDTWTGVSVPYPVDTPDPPPKTFDSMYYDRIPRLWKKHRQDVLTTRDFYELNEALILSETCPREGTRALKRLLGSSFCMGRVMSRPIATAPAGKLNMTMLN